MLNMAWVSLFQDVNGSCNRICPHIGFIRPLYDDSRLFRSKLYFHSRKGDPIFRFAHFG